jgi:hypothetical protein
VQTLSVGSLLAMQLCQPPLGVALPIGPDPGLLPWLESAVEVVVVGIIGPALAFHCALEPPNGTITPLQFVTELHKLGLLRRDNADSRGANVQPDLALTKAMLWLAVGLALAHQLDIKALAPI